MKKDVIRQVIEKAQKERVAMLVNKNRLLQLQTAEFLKHPCFKGLKNVSVLVESMRKRENIDSVFGCCKKGTIVINKDWLVTNPEDSKVKGVLLHEIVHTWIQKNKIEDDSQHGARWQAKAQEAGLPEVHIKVAIYSDVLRGSKEVWADKKKKVSRYNLSDKEIYEGKFDHSIKVLEDYQSFLIAALKTEQTYSNLRKIDPITDIEFVPKRPSVISKLIRQSVT